MTKQATTVSLMSTKWRGNSIAAVALAAGVGGVPALGQPQPTRHPTVTVVRTSTSAPGGLTYLAHQHHAINDDAEVFFVADIVESVSIKPILFFWQDSGPTTSVVAYHNGEPPDISCPPPGTCDVEDASCHFNVGNTVPFFADVLSASNRTLFQASVHVTVESTLVCSGFGIWDWDSGVSSAFTESLHSYPKGIILHGFSNDRILYESAEDITSPTAPLVLFSNTGIVAYRGETAPGGPSGTVFQYFSYPCINSEGRVAFGARLDSMSPDPDQDSGMWTGFASNLQAIAIEGQQVLATGVEFEDFWGVPVTINSAGTVAFWANVRGDGISSSNRRCLWWREVGESLELVARLGDPAAGFSSGATYTGLYAPTTYIAPLSDTDEVAFLGGTNDPIFGGTYAIWSGVPGNLVVVAMQGEWAPGMDCETTFSDFGPPSIDSSGNVVFYATTSAGDGIWFGKEGRLSLIAAVGRPFDDELLPVTLAFLPESTGTDGRRAVVNGDGYVLFVASFDDDTSAIIRAQASPRCRGDLNDDGFVDGIDADIFNNLFEGSHEPFPACIDLNRDRFIDGLDSDLFNNYFEEPCE